MKRQLLLNIIFLASLCFSYAMAMDANTMLTYSSYKEIKEEHDDEVDSKRYLDSPPNGDQLDLKTIKLLDFLHKNDLSTSSMDSVDPSLKKHLRIFSRRGFINRTDTIYKPIDMLVNQKKLSDHRSFIGVMAGFNILNSSSKENESTQNQVGGFVGANLFLDRLLHFNNDWLLRSDILLNYSFLEGSNYEQDILSYHWSLMFGHKLINRLSGYLGPNIIMSFMDDSSVLLGFKADIWYSFRKLSFGLNYIAIPKQYNIDTQSRQVQHQSDISSILSVIVAYPLF